MPADNEVVVMLNAGALMTIDRTALADPVPLSVTLTVKVDDPAVVGVPEIAPPAMLSPVGSDPLATDHE